MPLYGGAALWLSRMETWAQIHPESGYEQAHGLRFPEGSSKAMEKEPELKTSYGCNCTVVVGLSEGLAVLVEECYLVMPLHAVSMHQVQLKILVGFLTRQLCQIPCHTNVSTLLSWKCWKEVTVYVDLIHVLSLVFCSCGLVQAWGEKVLKFGQVLGSSVKCWNSCGSDSSALELPAQFRSLLKAMICSSGLLHPLLKCPSTPRVSQNRDFKSFIPQTVCY